MYLSKQNIYEYVEWNEVLIRYTFKDNLAGDNVKCVGLRIINLSINKITLCSSVGKKFSK